MRLMVTLWLVDTTVLSITPGCDPEDKAFSSITPGLRKEVALEKFYHCAKMERIGVTPHTGQFEGTS